MNITLRQLRAFIAVARTGSFTVAAESMHVTQSALSSLIKEMEQALGVQMFDRTTRRLELSEVGKDFYPLIDKLVLDLDGVLGEINSLKALKKGVVRIAVPQLFACTLLPQVMGEYRKHYPDVQVKLIDCSVESVVSRVLTGEVDIGIGPERNLVSGIDATLLFEMPFMLVFPKKHPLEKKSRVTWADAASLPLITLQGEFAERLALDLHGDFRNVTLNPTNEVTFMTTALAMVSANLGVTACLPYAESLVKLYQLQMRRLRDPEVTRKFFVFSRHGRSPMPAAESFVNFLHDFVEREGLAKYK